MNSPFAHFSSDGYTRMVRTLSTMLELGTPAPDFSLINVDGRTVSLADFAGHPALLVIFLCNHCPYVKHIAPSLAQIAAELQARGIAVVGISSNDASAYPADSPEQMVHEAEAQGYTFPYLYDEDQSVARAYKAACTPDFFLFDREQKLVYRGQLDSSRPSNGVPVTGDDLRAAVNALLAGQPIPEPQRPSMGCNIKWKAGQEPYYFNPG
jgi:peroxiredoxin